MPEQPLYERTYKAAADLSAKQGYVAGHGLVTGEAILGTADTVPAGVITDTPILGQPTKIGERGVFHVYSGAAVTRLAPVACDATGRVIDATSAHTWIVGVALEACDASGTLIEVWVQPALNLLAEGYTKPATGIPASDLAAAVQTSLADADSAYQLPETGIPGTDLAADADIAGSQLAADAGIAGTQLAADANIAVSQLAAIASTVTVNNAGGTGTLALAGFGLLYHVQATLISGPAGAMLKFTKGENSLGIAVVDATDQAVACDVTNAVVDVIAFNLPEA